MVAQMVQNSIFTFRGFFIFRDFIFSEVLIFRYFVIFRDIFRFSEISVCTETFFKNSCFKNVKKKLLSRTAMLEFFSGTLAGISENLFTPNCGKRNSTVDSISGIFQNYKNLQR